MIWRSRDGERSRRESHRRRNGLVSPSKELLVTTRASLAYRRSAIGSESPKDSRSGPRRRHVMSLPPPQRILRRLLHRFLAAGPRLKGRYHCIVQGAANPSKELCTARPAALDIGSGGKPRSLQVDAVQAQGCTQIKLLSCGRLI
jgi:hypothetical protein